MDKNKALVISGLLVIVVSMAYSYYQSEFYSQPEQDTYKKGEMKPANSLTTNQQNSLEPSYNKEDSKIQNKRPYPNTYDQKKSKRLEKVDNYPSPTKTQALFKRYKD